MTTPALETVSGLVEHINARGTGIKVAGRWLNVSQYYALVELPKLVSECRSTSSWAIGERTPLVRQAIPTATHPAPLFRGQRSHAQPRC